MKSLLLVATLLFSVAGQAQKASDETQITVTISNVSGNEGKVILSLFDEETFMQAPPLKSGTSEIIEGQATYTFKDVPAGVYSVISFHDKNDNDRIDMEPTGMPTEDYGVSNNPMSFGPPQWTESKFEVKDSPVSIEIRY